MAALDAIYGTVRQPETWPGTLTEIARVLDAKSAALFTRSSDGVLVAVASPNLDGVLVEYNEGWWRQDIAMQRAIEYTMSSGEDVVNDQAVVSQHERQNHPFYVDFLRRHGLGPLISSSVSPSARTLVRLAVQGAAERRLFDETDMHLLGQLSRHCERALALACSIAEQKLAAESLGTALSALGHGVFIIDANCKVAGANPSGERLLGDGLTLVGGRLAPSDPQGRSALDAALLSAVQFDQVSSLDCCKPIVLRRSEERRPLIARVIPLRSRVNPTPSMLLPEGAALCLISDCEHHTAFDPALIRDVLGLTLGEARVAAEIGLGAAPREAAKALEISEETVRTVLKRVYSKTGTKRQSELAALLARLNAVDMRG